MEERHSNELSLGEQLTNAMKLQSVRIDELYGMIKLLHETQTNLLDAVKLLGEIVKAHNEKV
jgi:hypothetical protein